VFDVQVGPTEVELAAWDTCGQPEYDRLRPLSYPDSHVIIITFALDDSGSLDSVVERVRCSRSPRCRGTDHIDIVLLIDSGIPKLLIIIQEYRFCSLVLKRTYVGLPSVIESKHRS
jgi:GTPase SAR1 family protein